MVEMEERELLASLRGYLEELKESGIEELPFGDSSQAAPVQAAPAQAAPAQAAPAQAAPAQAAPAQAAPAQQPPAFSVEGAGNPQARLLFVRGGAALAPASRELLGKMVAAMGFAAPDVYMVRFSAEDGEAAGLREAVLQKVSAVAPEVTVALGETAAQLLLNRREPIAALRGRLSNVAKTAVMATLDPDQLVADEGLKRQVWTEMKQVMARLSGKG